MKRKWKFFRGGTMKKIISILCFVILLAHSPSLIAGEFGLDSTPERWSQSSRMGISYRLPGPNSGLSFEEELEYRNETRPNGRLVLEFPRYFPNLYVMSTAIEFEGEGSKKFRFNSGDKIFSSDTLFDSQFTINEIDLALYYDVPFFKSMTSDRLNIDLGLNVRAIEFDGKIEQETIANGSKSFIVPIPMVFGALQFQPLQALALEAEGRGVSLGPNKAFSIVGRIRWNVMDHVFAAGGYRFDKFDINYQGVLIDTNVSGPFFEAGLSF